MGEESIIVELFPIVETIVHQTTYENHPYNRLKIDQCYYVDMPQGPIVIEEHP
jgi:hypothetical protein